MAAIQLDIFISAGPAEVKEAPIAEHRLIWKKKLLKALKGFKL